MIRWRKLTLKVYPPATLVKVAAYKSLRAAFEWPPIYTWDLSARAGEAVDRSMVFSLTLYVLCEPSDILNIVEKRPDTPTRDYMITVEQILYLMTL